MFFTRGGPMKGRGANVSRKPRWGKFIRGDGKSFEIRKGVSNHDDGDTRGKEGECRGGRRGSVFPGGVFLYLKFAFGGKGKNGGGEEGGNMVVREGGEA